MYNSLLKKGYPLKYKVQGYKEQEDTRGLKYYAMIFIMVLTCITNDYAGYKRDSQTIARYP